MKRLNHEDRTHLRRTVLDYQSRPQNETPPTRAPDVERPDVLDPATIGMALLAEELHAHEVVMTVDELDATRMERFGHGDEIREKKLEGIVLEPVCERCGNPIMQDEASGFWRHVSVQPGCAVATLHFRESRL